MSKNSFQKILRHSIFFSIGFLVTLFALVFFQGLRAEVAVKRAPRVFPNCIHALVQAARGELQIEVDADLLEQEMAAKKELNLWMSLGAPAVNSKLDIKIATALESLLEVNRSIARDAYASFKKRIFDDYGFLKLGNLEYQKAVSDYRLLFVTHIQDLEIYLSYIPEYLALHAQVKEQIGLLKHLSESLSTPRAGDLDALITHFFSSTAEPSQSGG